MLNSEAEGGNEPSPVCPLGPSSCLLPRSYFPLDIWLDTFQVRVHIPEFWVRAAFGALWVPPPPLRPRVPLVFLEAGATREGHVGEAARVPHSNLAPHV